MQTKHYQNGKEKIKTWTIVYDKQTHLPSEESPKRVFELWIL